MYCLLLNNERVMSKQITTSIIVSGFTCFQTSRIVLYSTKHMLHNIHLLFALRQIYFPVIIYFFY
jgi:hypothetical protein